MKIGDFGLATSSPLTTLPSVVTIDVSDGGCHITLLNDKSSEIASNSGQLTGQVGTALYVAPELKASCKCNPIDLVFHIVRVVNIGYLDQFVLSYSKQSKLQRKSGHL